jgi:ABC-type dipeptide/oligopeptide/nickel transport system permease component
MSVVKMSVAGTPQESSDSWQQTPAAVPARKNGLAVAALILGILACVLFWTVIGGILVGLIAVVLGIIAAVKARGGRAPHRAMAIIGTVLGALALIASVIIVAVGVSILNSSEFKNFNDCVRHVHSQADRDQCTKDFKQDVSN